MKDNEQEIFPIVDEGGKVVGKATRGECHSGTKLLHPVVHVHRTTYEGDIRPSKDELDGGRFWTMQEIREAIGQGVLTPNFESEFQRFIIIDN